MATMYEFFGEVYGARWPGLLEALTAEPPPKTALLNPFNANLEDYHLDEASLAPVEALDLDRGDLVADFCSAPGGKLVAMVFKAAAENRLEGTRFVANDLSSARAARLRAVLHDCVPPEVLAQVEVFRGDASTWGRRQKNAFDKVLVDAPCSGERHWLGSDREADRWSMKSSKRLSVRQHALLCSALDCVRPGGRVVYSTCSISPIENDGVIERLQESREGCFEVHPAPDVTGEATRFGRIVLPDRGGGHGPIFTAVLTKS